MSINRVILNDADLEGFSSQIASFDPDRKPISLRYRNVIFFEIFPLDVIHSPQPESYLILILIKFIVLLLYLFEVLEEKMDEITHVRLVDPLPGRGMEDGVLNGNPKFYRGEKTKGQDRCFLISFAIKNGQR